MAAWSQWIVKGAGLVFIGLALLFMVTGAGACWEQFRRLHSCRPVRAVVSKAEIRQGEGESARRVVDFSFRYEVDGKSYRSSRILPLSERWGSEHDRLLRELQDGDIVEAYHDPRNPADAFLVRNYKAGPYGFLTFPLPHLVAGLMLLRIPSPIRHGEPRPPLPRGDGWFEAPPRYRLGRRLRFWGALLGVWLLGGLAWAHYYIAADPIEAAAVPFSIIHAAGLAIAGKFTLDNWRLGRRVRDLALLIDRERPALGSCLRIQLAAEFAGPVEVRRWDLALICDEIDRRMQGIGLHVAPAAIFERRAGGRKPRRFEAGSQAILRWQVEIPEDLPPSSPAGEPEFPLHDWRLDLDLRLAGLPAFRSAYVLRVDGLGAGTSDPPEPPENTQK